MTRLFYLLPLIAGALAMDSGSSDMSSSSDKQMNSSGNGVEVSQNGDITINVQIKIVGSFNGNGKWNWQGAKPGAGATIRQVTVGDIKDGKPILAYDPPSLEALPGDFVQFNFKAQNHTVTQSTLEKPCVRMEGGMDSGFMPNPNNTMPVAPSMMVAINDTKPLWFYCRQSTHCGKGMAFSINPGGPEKMTQFMNNAKAQNGTVGALPASGALAANSTSSGNGTALGQNGLPISSAIPSPSAAPLTDIVPGADPASAGNGASNAQSTGGPGSGGAPDPCICSCRCDLGIPGMGGMIGLMPVPSAIPAQGKRSVHF